MKVYIEKHEVLKMLSEEYQKAFKEEGVFAAATIAKLREKIDDMEGIALEAQKK